MKNQYRLSEGSSVILDLIRGLSAQAVLIGHGISIFGIANFLHEPNFPWIQNMAVVIFFILSGFLISYSTLEKLKSDKPYTIGIYLADRFSRIYVAFIPCIICVLLIDYSSVQLNPSGYQFYDSFNFSTFIGNLFMLQDFPLDFQSFDFQSFGSAKPFWTLAIEWWIYLFFGLTSIVLIRTKLKLSTIILTALVSIGPLYFLIMGRGNSLSIFWLMGMLLYLAISSTKSNKFNRIILLGFTILFLALAVFRAYIKMNSYDPTSGFLFACFIGLAIIYFKDVKFKPWLKKLITGNANFSFSLYLVHYSVLAIISSLFSGQANPVILFIIGFCLSNLLSYFLGQLFEIKLTKIIRSFLRKKWGHFNLK